MSPAIISFLAELARSEIEKVGEGGDQHAVAERVVGSWLATQSPATADEQDTMYFVVAFMAQAPIKLPVRKTDFPTDHPNSVN